MRCKECIWFNNDTGNSCEAFPNGIPIEILTDKLKHISKFPEQVGDFTYQTEIDMTGFTPLIPDPFDLDDMITIKD
jgi:hypothetical protein